MSSESSEIIVPGRADFIAAKPTPSVIRVAQKCSNTIVGVLGISGVTTIKTSWSVFGRWLGSGSC